MDIEFKGVDFGHSNLYENLLLTGAKDVPAIEEGARKETLRFINSRPVLNPNEEAIAPTYMKLAWKAQNTFDEAHALHRATYDIYVSDVADKEGQAAISWANHLVILYPLWLGSMPALLKAFFEQVFRPGFAFEYGESGLNPKKRLMGKSARIIVTMHMPAFVYRWFFFAHSLKSLERNILAFSGIGPIKASIIGSIEAMNEKQRAEWLDEMRALGDIGK